MLVGAITAACSRRPAFSSGCLINNRRNPGQLFLPGRSVFLNKKRLQQLAVHTLEYYKLPQADQLNNRTGFKGAPGSLRPTFTSRSTASCSTLASNCRGRRCSLKAAPPADPGDLIESRPTVYVWCAGRRCTSSVPQLSWLYCSRKCTSKSAHSKMGEGEVDVKTREEPPIELQEGGEIFFFYRPKVNVEEPESVDDVQRMYIVLRPQSAEKETEIKQAPGAATKEGKAGGEENGQQKETAREELKEKEEGQGEEETKIGKDELLRLLIIGRKSLPDPSKRTRPFWGHVDLVTQRAEEIKKALTGEEYETKTRGTQHRPAARPVGEGVYRLLRHQKGSRTDTHLVYKLEVPTEDKKREPQDAMNISPEASYIIQIKNPEQPTPPYVGLSSKRRAAFPASLQGQIGSLRFHPCDPVDFLNYEGCEFILISASDDIEEELGLKLQGEDADRPDLLEQFGDPGPEGKRKLKPLFEGEWA